MSFKDFFSNDFSTSDNAKQEMLLTRYYRNDYNTTKKAIIDAGTELGYTLKSVNDNYRELLFESSYADVTITVINVTYYETAVDFKIITKYIISAGRGIKRVDEFYNAISKKLQFHHRGNQR